MIDIILVGEPNEITKACMASLQASHYDNTIEVVPYDGYNKSLNHGARKGSNKYIAFCNNDLEFGKDWDYHIIEALKDQLTIVSASPWCPKTHRQWWGNEVPQENVIGTHTGKIVAGWCLVLKREWWKEMGGFDERFLFWCCDNSYTEQLKQAGKFHCLVMASIVTHHQSLTLDNFKGTPRYGELTHAEVKKFNRLFNQNKFNLGT